MDYSFNRHLSVFIFLLLIVTGVTEHAFACRYNVRETGFIYLAQKPYHLVIYYANTTSGKDVEMLKQLASHHFQDSNIEPQFVNIDDADSSSGYQESDKSTPLPAAMLQSPDGQIIEIPLSSNGLSLEASASKAFESISYSSIRDEILRKCISNYAVILLFEGTDSNANKEAREAAKAAIEHIASKMSLLPKKIDIPPILLTISNNDPDYILRWSLGVDSAKLQKPMMAIIYGRGRWIGPILEGEMISKRNLSELLLIVGADCECGIDKDWMRGTMIPASWNEKSRKDVALNLEFDPENPLIKKEVRHILRMGEFYGNRPQNDTIINIAPAEILVRDNQEKQVTEQNPEVQIYPILKIIGLIIFAILATGVFLFLKK